jgi:hypothetical protein
MTDLAQAGSAFEVEFPRIDFIISLNKGVKAKKNLLIALEKFKGMNPLHILPSELNQIYGEQS